MFYRINSKRFVSRWILNGYLVWPLAILLGIPGGIVFGIISDVVRPDYYGYEYYQYAERPLELLLMGLLVLYLGGAIGLAVGMLQKSVVGNHLFYNLRRWQVMTTLGGIVGGGAIYLIMELLETFNPYRDFFVSDASSNAFQLVSTVAPMLVFITILSVFQAVELARYVRHAWLWVLANAVGGLLFGTVIVYGSESLLTVVLPVFAQAGVTGGTMLWLFQTSVRDDVEFEDEYGNKLAPVRVPVRYDD